jgi:hypothetical protein
MSELVCFGCIVLKLKKLNYVAIVRVRTVPNAHQMVIEI